MRKITCSDDSRSWHRTGEGCLTVNACLPTALARPWYDSRLQQGAGTFAAWKLGGNFLFGTGYTSSKFGGAPSLKPPPLLSCVNHFHLNSRRLSHPCIPSHKPISTQQKAPISHLPSHFSQSPSSRSSSSTQLTSATGLAEPTISIRRRHHPWFDCLTAGVDNEVHSSPRHHRRCVRRCPGRRFPSQLP